MRKTFLGFAALALFVVSTSDVAIASTVQTSRAILFRVKANHGKTYASLRRTTTSTTLRVVQESKKTDTGLTDYVCRIPGTNVYAVAPAQGRGIIAITDLSLDRAGHFLHKEPTATDVGFQLQLALLSGGGTTTGQVNIEDVPHPRKTVVGRLESRSAAALLGKRERIELTLDGPTVHFLAPFGVEIEASLVTEPEK
jgi:hypothetical protein